jgi:cell wall-associated NlpC family hydrolase
MIEQEAAQRRRVVDVALSWLRTPYHPGSHLKGIGCDCTFIADVFEEAGLVDHVEIETYSPQWHLHQREEKYLGYVLRYAREIEKSELKPADIVLFKCGRVLSHSAIVIFPGWPRLIHSGMRERMVTCIEGDRGELAQPMLKPRYFSIFGR